MAPISGRFWRETLETVIIALIMAFFIRTFGVESFLVFGNSMEPNIHNSERLLINKLVYRLRKPVHGEIIVFKYPRDPSRDFIKRVIAVEGETVEVLNGTVYRDGKVVEEPYLAQTGLGDFPPLQVEAGSVFVLGDNRDASEDSRFFGTVSHEYLRGKAMFVYWPLARGRWLR